MCGLAGLWLPQSTPSDALRAQARAMADAIAHRGPDDAGLWCDPAVLDLSPSGHQPMASATGRYVIAFNGEIYNHLELRRELERTGQLQRAWRGHSDTETLLAAIALWDRRERVLWLARDRFGEKPLYWGWITTTGAGGAAGRNGPARVLAFGSELVALRALPGAAAPRPDPSALAAFFRLGCIPAPLCIQAGLQQAQARPFGSEAEALGALEAALQQAVAEQAIADVPLGAFLSGGIDSSLITALLQAASSRPVRSFTIAFPDSPGFNEAPYAAAVAAHLGTDHTEVALTAADARALIPQLAQIYSEPFADSSQLPTHLVCREARRNGLTVALSGDGGDELFGGYNRHRLIPALHRRLGPLRCCSPSGNRRLSPVARQCRPCRRPPPRPNS